MHSQTMAQVDMHELLEAPQENLTEKVQLHSTHHAAKQGKCVWQLRCIMTCSSVSCIVVACLFVFCVWWSRLSAIELKLWPGLEGEIPTEDFFLLHVGGFCFGSRRIDVDARVGEMELHLTGSSSEPWWNVGELYLLVFDDQPSHWGKAKSPWNVTWWPDKVAHANTCVQVFSNHSFNGYHLKGDSSNTVRIKMTIRERFKRHWNLALLGLGLQHNGSSKAPMHYKILASNALSSWGAASRDISSSCPWEMSEFVKEETVKATVGSTNLRPGLPSEPSDMCHSLLSKNYSKLSM